MATSRSWASFPRRNTDTSTNDEDQSLENLTQPTKPEPQETIRRLTSRETLFMSPSKTWNLYRRNPWYLSWQQETWAMIFSLSCLIAVAVIMAWIDGKRLSIWHWAIQPNAVISVLIVSSKAALMISTASCVSQLKWTHFQKRPRQLRDLEGFDDASRGAWGSVQLLFSPSGYLNVAVTLGCAVTVLVLAMETFGQQLLSFPERRIPVTNETASFPVIQNFNAMPSWGTGVQLSDRLLKSRLGLMESIYGQTTDPPFDCPASSCSWDSHVTLGLCSRCEDVSSTPGGCEIKITTKSNKFDQYNETTLECDYDTGKGRNLTTIRRALGVAKDIPDPNNASAWTYSTAIDVSTWDTDAFYNKGQPAVAFNFSAIVTNDTWERPQITTCSLYFCAWVYENSTAQGQNFNEGKLEKYILGYDSIQRTQTGPGANMDTSNYTFSANGTGFPSDKHNETFTVYGDADSEMFGHLTTILESSTFSYVSGSNASTAGLGDALMVNPNITELADRMSTSMTNVWRQYQSTPAIGTAWESVAFIHVEWAWLALPAAAVAGAGAVLLMTLIQNRRTVLWKSSVLPYSFRSLHGWEDADFDMETLDEIRDRAKEMKGQLIGDENERVRLVKS
ncbi:hypothetical protein D6C91_06744 [Aureobasidium pullulans]|uniref:Uncharacterized protein n=1 Tax=Aureobasidium pullulans TaxID=5580 RepID=A0A4S9SUN5_AURPU|nr:hypothetical protein D6C91_06744 [Aureobasidium pullulans]